jgi:hypothetical protein
MDVSMHSDILFCTFYYNMQRKSNVLKIKAHIVSQKLFWFQEILFFILEFFLLQIFSFHIDSKKLLYSNYFFDSSENEILGRSQNMTFAQLTKKLYVTQTKASLPRSYVRNFA